MLTRQNAMLNDSFSAAFLIISRSDGFTQPALIVVLRASSRVQTIPSERDLLKADLPSGAVISASGQRGRGLCESGSTAP